MKQFLYMTAILSVMAAASCKPREKADMILTNATIYTVDKAFTIRQGGFAIRDGKFLAVGTDREILDRFESENRIDLKGLPVYPGFYDAHCHFTGYAATLARADLAGASDTGEVIRRLRENQETNPTKWVIGRGWDQNDWPGKEFPDRSVLDEAFPDKPVYLTRIDGHAAWVNSKAIELAGITADTHVSGGEVILQNGKVTGILVDNAMDLVSSLVPGLSEEETATALLRAQENCFAVGLTSVADAGLGAGEVRLIDRLQQAGSLKMRIYAMLSPSRENLDEFVFKGVYRTDRLNVRCVKLYADGALGSRGALMLAPYADAPDKLGLQVNETAFLRDICATCYAAGYQVATHCIGDSANRLMLGIYSESLKGKNDLRWRIEHAQVIHPDDFHLFGDYSIVPSIQTTHATSDMYWAADRIGPERILGAYAYRRLSEENGWLPNGSDFPVERINPLLGFFAGFARMDEKGYPEGGWMPENGLSREDCLRAMTIWAARSCFEENERGSIEPGKDADFVVLDQDILTAPALGIPSVRVAETWIAGERVYHSSTK